MVTNQEILAWLQGLPETQIISPVQSPSEQPTALPSRTPKRKATQGLSPPATISEMERPETPAIKRRRLEPKDLNLTPKALQDTSQDPFKPASQTSSNTSSHSRSSSSLKRQLLALRLDEYGLDTKELSIESLKAIPNDEAVLLLRTMRRISIRKGILPSDHQAHIMKSHEISDDDDDWELAFKNSSSFMGLPGRIPEPDENNFIREWAKECVDLDDHEAGWNDEVHFRLLQAVFREPGKKTGGLFNVATCNSARPHKTWLPKSVGSKMVDFCIYADTAQDDMSLKTLQAFCRSTPTQSVNHTDFRRAQLRPIVLSIETKAENHDLGKAEIQIGVWHAAQWSFLRASLIATKHKSAGLLPTPQEVGEAEEALSRLPFIPAVIAQGSRWHFVLSTRRGQQTILRKEQQFGRTSSVVETYQVVAGLRELTSWAEKVYLPWFEREILTPHRPEIAIASPDV
ncbi:hypothetical protein ACHAQD_011918 [Fusarium lateritium]